ncbi:hypothetical protein [Methylobacterium sp. A54F]
MIAIVSVSDFAPSRPLLPLSFVSTVSVAVPLKSAAGLNAVPFRAALIAVWEPDRVTDPDPLSRTEERPVVDPRVIVPVVAVSLTVRRSDPASESETVMAFLFVLLKMIEPSSETFADPGTVLTGGSL